VVKISRQQIRAYVIVQFSGTTSAGFIIAICEGFPEPVGIVALAPRRAFAGGSVESKAAAPV
jgi:hypothetical protein